MSDKKKSKLIITEDHSEKFTESTCPCDFCEDTNKKAKNFKNNIPITKLQKTMMEVIERIEKRELDKKLIFS